VAYDRTRVFEAIFNTGYCKQYSLMDGTATQYRG